MSVISTEIEMTIQEQLSIIESTHDVKILYACESGSRAWGFASSDSDYDVRFIYVHPQDWYLSINLEDRRDVIEVPISDDLDISGWDLRKALQLFKKSNPPLLEWLGSPIVYRDVGSLAQQLRTLSSNYFYLTACRYHYLRMAEGNFRGYLKGEEVRLKKYFYVLRPVLAVNWIDAGRGVVPTEFNILLDAVIPEGKIKDAIHKLLEAKKQGFESTVGPRIAPISEYIESELERLNALKPDFEKGIGATEVLNQLFQRTLRDA